MRITQPVGIGLLDWAAQLSTDLISIGYVPRLDDENKWQEWASMMFMNLGLRVINPYDFNNWREWAQRFCESL